MSTEKFNIEESEGWMVLEVVLIDVNKSDEMFKFW